MAIQVKSKNANSIIYCLMPSSFHNESCSFLGIQHTVPPEPLYNVIYQNRKEKGIQGRKAIFLSNFEKQLKVIKMEWIANINYFIITPVSVTYTNYCICLFLCDSLLRNPSHSPRYI